MNLTELGRKIQTAREELKMTQEQLADAIGCSQSALSNYEKGKRRIYLSHLEKLSAVLDKPLEYFVETLGESNMETPPLSPDYLGSDLIKLMNSFYSLNENERQQVIDFVEYLEWKKRKEHT